jgi:hypothetical protein
MRHDSGITRYPINLKWAKYRRNGFSGQDKASRKQTRSTNGVKKKTNLFGLYSSEEKKIQALSGLNSCLGI